MTELERLQHNEVIYKAQIKNLHRLLGMLVHGVQGTPTYATAYIEARELVLAAHMTEYKPGEVANND